MESLPTPPWIMPPEGDPKAREALCAEAGVHPLVADMLLRRGIADPEAAKVFFQPGLAGLHDPFLLKGMEAGVERIARALKSGERIVVSGDYDVDGATSSALLTHFLRAAGAGTETLEFFIPNRFEHGYGLTSATVDALLAKKPALVITVDNGITAVEEVARLQAAGVDTIVTDHHLPLPEGVPPGIVINPLQPGCAYPYKRISGCGVAFKLITALRKRLREQGHWSSKTPGSNIPGGGLPEPNLKRYLDLVAIATVADIVPLTGENRLLVHHGLIELNAGPRRPGVEALLANGNKGRGRGDNGQVTSRTIGFRLGPRLNAAGRMKDGALATELLLSEDPARAAELAAALERENDNRRTVGDAMFRDAVRRIEEDGLQRAAGIVVSSQDFHEGIIGIVASRLVDRYHRPVLVLAENGACWKGSARSVPGINVTEAIAAGAALMEDYGGHPGAGGCRFAKDHLGEVTSRFQEACGRQAERAEAPARLLDGHLLPGSFDEALVEQVLRMEPFGHENEEPTFLIEQDALPAPPEVLKERHLKWRVAPGVEMVGWNLAEGHASEAGAAYRVRLGFNEYRGRRTVQLTVEEARGPA
ncbi:MAG: single-stranded-DNA-specific exonuclease RecJ [bacterium]